MSVTPLSVPVPELSGIVVGRDVAGRVLRITGHPDAGRVVLSIWQGAGCVATVRLAPEDVAEVTAALIRAAVPPGRAKPSRRPEGAEPATVTRLPVPGRPDPSITSIGTDAAELARRGWDRVRRFFGPQDQRPD